MLDIFRFVLDIMFFIFKVVGVFLFPFIVSFSFFLLYFIVVKKMKFIKREFKKPKKLSKFIRLFIMFPRQFALDCIRKNPNNFNEFGLHMVCGEQGAGKSVTCTYILKQWKECFPNLCIRSNVFLSFQDDMLTSITDVLDNNNGPSGQVDYFGEIQQEFNSLNSKNFPPEMIGEVCMQRKQYKVILGDGQVFSRIAKPLREQTFYLYEPKTLFGCLTIVPVYKPNVDSDGNIVNKRFLRCFFFVQSDELRDSFDTREKVKRLAKVGFKPRNEQLSNHNTPVINIESK